MPWRYQAYKYEDGSVGIHEHYKLGDQQACCEKPTIVVSPGNPDDLVSIVQALKKEATRMENDVLKYGVLPWWENE